MTNEGKTKIIDRAIEFIKCNTPQSKLRMAGATIAELELVKNCDLADVGGNEVALCRCSEDETTGWIKLKCCNICGKPQEQ